jgi:LysR family transcriptional regulator, regulator of abg operon
LPIDPRALRTYLAVCREGSITGAAHKLNISQPAVSVTVGQLEQSLGTILFERSRAGIVLSPAGKALMRRAEALESLLKAAEEEVALAQQAIAGPFRIGGTPGALASLVPELVAALGRRGIRHSMHIVERSDAELVEMLRKGELDVAMATTAIEALPPDIDERTLLRDPFGLIVGRANQHLPDRLSLRETSDMRWVLPEAAGGFRRQINALFLAANARIPGEVVRCDSLLSTKAIVRTTDHVTILPHGVATAELETGALRAIEIVDGPIRRNIGVRFLKASEGTATVLELLACFGGTE